MAFPLVPGTLTPMTTALIYSDRFLDHATGKNHPERPDRLRSVVQQLRQDAVWDRVEHLDFAPTDVSTICRVHDPVYVQRLQDACRNGEQYIDAPDSAICPASFDVALLAVGGILAAADAVMSQRVHNAFCAVRPPGHHAEADHSMGFCLFNNVAVAAQHLIDRHQLERVMIVDFDVHHGNGTQHIFESRRDVFYISLHEHPKYLYPGTGHDYETGHGDGTGYTLNIPLMPHSGDDEFKHAFETRVLPTIRNYQPQALLLSAGFDASDQDPLGHLRVSEQGFQWISEQLTACAEQLCSGRLVSILEGGYHLTSLARNVSNHVQALIAADSSKFLV